MRKYTLIAISLLILPIITITIYNFVIDTVWDNKQNSIEDITTGRTPYLALNSPYSRVYSFAEFNNGFTVAEEEEKYNICFSFNVASYDESVDSQFPVRFLPEPMPASQFLNDLEIVLNDKSILDYTIARDSVGVIQPDLIYRCFYVQLEVGNYNLQLSTAYQDTEIIFEIVEQ